MSHLEQAIMKEKENSEITNVTAKMKVTSELKENAASAKRNLEREQSSRKLEENILKVMGSLNSQFEKPHLSGKT